MNPLILLAAEEGKQLPRKIPLGEAAVIVIIGFLLVIVVLAILAGLLYLFKLAFSIKLKPKAKKQVAPVETVANDQSPAEDEEEIVAAIAAVIACLDSESGAQAPFKVKSITRLK